MYEKRFSGTAVGETEDVYKRQVVGGSLIVEQVFNIAGIGALMQQAVGNRDYLIVQGSVLVISLVTVGCNLLVDILYGFVDPRIRKAKR